MIQFSKIKNAISGDTVAVLVYNMRSLGRHVGYILSGKRIIYNDIIGFTETQIKSLDSTWKIVETLNLMNIIFNNNRDKVLSLANRCRNGVTVLNKFYANALSILSFKKLDFANKVFKVLLVYRKQSMQMQ